MCQDFFKMCCDCDSHSLPVSILSVFSKAGYIRGGYLSSRTTVWRDFDEGIVGKSSGLSIC
jgi:hypothetical protein